MTVSPQTPALSLEYPDRAAPDLLAGVLYQVLWSACRWMELGADEILICEGDEDLVRETIRGGQVVELGLEQIKRLSSRLTARSPAVYETVFAFLCSYEVHSKAKRLTSFVFTTSARRGTQQKDAPGGADALTVDLLSAWSELTPTAPDDAIEQVAAAVRALIEAYAAKAFADPGPGHKGPKPSITEARIRGAARFLDAAPERWREFLTATRWDLEQESSKSLVQRLTARISCDARSCDLPPDLFALRLLFEALRIGSEPEVTDRALSAASFAEVARTSRATLEAWVAETHAERLWPLWVSRELESLKGNVADLRAAVDGLLGGDSPSIDGASRERYREALSQEAPVLSMPDVTAGMLSIEAAWTLEARWLDEDRKFPVVRLSASSSRAVLLSAPPGWGKSTALRLLTHAALDDAAALPVRVSLRHVASHMSGGTSFPMALAREVGERYRFSEAVGRALVGSLTLLLADGLDEVGGPLGAVAEGLNTFARVHPEARIVVTTRERHASAAASEFRRATLVGLAPHEVVTVAEKLLQSIRKAAARSAAAAGPPSADDAEVLRRFRLIVERLGGEPTPLLVTVALQLARWRDTVPVSRYDLFEQFLESIRSRPVLDRPADDPGAATAQLALAVVAWKQTEAHVLAWAKATDAVRMALLQGEAPVKAARLADECLRFWEARGVLARVGVAGVECVEFAHEELRSFSAARFLIELTPEERRPWLAVNGRVEPELVELAVQRGGNPILEDVFAALPADVWENVLERARGVAAAPEARPEFASRVAADAARLLRCEIADVVAQALDALLPIVNRAPGPFASAAKEALTAPGRWNVLAAHRVLVEAGEPFVDTDALLETLRESLAPPRTDGGQHDANVEWSLWNGLVVPAVGYLARHAKTAAVDELVERIVLGGAAISADAMQRLSLVLPEIGYRKLVERLREKYAATATRSVAWMTDSWRGDILFLTLVGAAFSGAVPTERTDTSALGRLLGALDFGSAMLAEWYPGQAAVAPSAVGTVFRGVACALGLSGGDLLGEIRVAISTTVPETEPGGLYLGLLSIARQDPDEPDWSRSAVLDLPVGDLFEALLAPGSVWPRSAGELLAHHRDQAAVRERLQALLDQIPDGKGHLLAEYTLRILGGDAPPLIAASLERELTSTNAALLVALAIVDPDSSRTAQLIEQGLASSCGGVVLRAAEAVGGIGSPTQLAGALKRTVVKWAEWAQGRGPLQNRSEGAVVCGTTLHAADVLRAAFETLAKIAPLSLVELVELRKESALASVATRALVAVAGQQPDTLGWLLDEIDAGALDSDVLDVLLANPPAQLRVLSERVLAFGRHASPEVRGVLIRSLAKATWVPADKATDVLQQALEDPVAELRSDASRALRGEAETGFALRLRRARIRERT